MKKCKAWLSAEGFSVDTKLNIASQHPGDSTYTTISFPSHLMVKLYTEVDTDGRYRVMVRLAIDGDPRESREGESVEVAVCATQKEADEAIKEIQKVTGMGAKSTTARNVTLAFSLGLVVAAIFSVGIEKPSVIMPAISQISSSNSGEMSKPSVSQNGLGQDERTPIAKADDLLKVPDFNTGTNSDVGISANTDYGKAPAPGDAEKLANNIDSPPGPRAIIREILSTDAYFQGNPKKPNPGLVVFSDPTCPSCKEFDQMLKKLDVPYIVVPLGVLSDTAKAVATKVLCSPDPANAYDEFFKNRSIDLVNPDKEKVVRCADKVLRNNAYFSLLKKNAVPTVMRFYDYSVEVGSFEKPEDLMSWVNGGPFKGHAVPEPQQGKVETSDAK